MKLLDKQELSCRNKKVESTFFCYSGSFLFVSKQQSKLHGNDKTAVFDGRHGGGRTIQDYVSDPTSISIFLPLPLGPGMVTPTAGVHCLFVVIGNHYITVW